MNERSNSNVNFRTQTTQTKHFAEQFWFTAMLNQGPALIEIYWGLSTAKYSSESNYHFRSTPVLHFTTAVSKV